MPQATTCLASHFGSRFRLQLIESEVCIAWQLWADSGQCVASFFSSVVIFGRGFLYW
jgi:hypothetical protein